jgi:hypothetical protein
MNFTKTKLFFELLIFMHEAKALFVCRVAKRCQLVGNRFDGDLIVKKMSKGLSHCLLTFRFGSRSIVLIVVSASDGLQSASSIYSAQEVRDYPERPE